MTDGSRWNGAHRGSSPWTTRIVGGSLGPASLRLKLLSEAHTATSVPSAVKCSSESRLSPASLFHHGPEELDRHLAVQHLFTPMLSGRTNPTFTSET